MKKTILSLAAVLTMFASVPAIYAAPVVDSASEVSVNESVSIEPKVNLIYQSKVPENVQTVDYRPTSDLQVYRASVKPGEHKRIAYIKLHEGQVVTVYMPRFSATLTNGAKEVLKPRNKSINIFVEKDGVYLVEVTLPKIPNLDVKEYSFNTCFFVQAGYRPRPHLSSMCNRAGHF